MKLVLATFAALALSLTVNAAPGGHGGGGGFGGGHGGGGFGGGHGGGFGGGHGGGFGGGHGGGFGGGHGGGGFHGGGHGGYHGGGHWRGGVWAPVYGGYYDGCGWDGYCGDSVSGTVACAPEVVEGNVAATDRTMAAIVATPEFATAKTFKSEVAQVAKIADQSERADAYMQLAGIDTNNKQQIADFVGARDAKGAWITELQRNAELTSAQAETVASKLQIALRGNLQ